MLLTVRRSKADQYAEGQVVAVAHGRHAGTDPIAALDAWLSYRGQAPGPLFTSMRNKVVTLEPISGRRSRSCSASAHGLLDSQPSGSAHSLRAGHATTAAVAGVALDRIAAQPRHKRLHAHRTLRLEHTSSRDLGL